MQVEKSHQIRIQFDRVSKEVSGDCKTRDPRLIFSLSLIWLLDHIGIKGLSQIDACIIYASLSKMNS